MEVKASLDYIASLSPAQVTGEPVSNKTIAPEKVRVIMWYSLFKIFTQCCQQCLKPKFLGIMELKVQMSLLRQKRNKKLVVLFLIVTYFKNCLLQPGL